MISSVSANNNPNYQNRHSIGGVVPSSTTTSTATTTATTRGTTVDQNTPTLQNNNMVRKNSTNQNNNITTTNNVQIENQNNTDYNSQIMNTTLPQTLSIFNSLTGEKISTNSNNFNNLESLKRFISSSFSIDTNNLFLLTPFGIKLKFSMVIRDEIQEIYVFDRKYFNVNNAFNSSNDTNKNPLTLDSDNNNVNQVDPELMTELNRRYLMNMIKPMESPIMIDGMELFVSQLTNLVQNYRSGNIMSIDSQDVDLNMLRSLLNSLKRNPAWASAILSDLKKSVYGEIHYLMNQYNGSSNMNASSFGSLFVGINNNNIPADDLESSVSREIEIILTSFNVMIHYVDLVFDNLKNSFDNSIELLVSLDENSLTGKWNEEYKKISKVRFEYKDSKTKEFKSIKLSDLIDKFELESNSINAIDLKKEINKKLVDLKSKIEIDIISQKNNLSKEFEVYREKYLFPIINNDENSANNSSSSPQPDSNNNRRKNSSPQISNKQTIYEKCLSILKELEKHVKKLIKSCKNLPNFDDLMIPIDNNSTRLSNSSIDKIESLLNYYNSHKNSLVPKITELSNELYKIQISKANSRLELQKNMISNTLILITKIQYNIIQCNSVVKSDILRDLQKLQDYEIHLSIVYDLPLIFGIWIIANINNIKWRMSLKKLISRTNEIFEMLRFVEIDSREKWISNFIKTSSTTKPISILFQEAMAKNNNTITKINKNDFPDNSDSISNTLSVLRLTPESQKRFVHSNLAPTDVNFYSDDDLFPLIENNKINNNRNNSLNSYNARKRMSRSPEPLVNESNSNKNNQNNNTVNANNNSYNSNSNNSHQNHGYDYEKVLVNPLNKFLQNLNAFTNPKYENPSNARRIRERDSPAPRSYGGRTGTTPTDISPNTNNLYLNKAPNMRHSNSTATATTTATATNDTKNLSVFWKDVFDSVTVHDIKNYINLLQEAEIDSHVIKQLRSYLRGFNDINTISNSSGLENDNFNQSITHNENGEMVITGGNISGFGTFDSQDPPFFKLFRQFLKSYEIDGIVISVKRKEEEDKNKRGGSISAGADGISTKKYDNDIRNELIKGYEKRIKKLENLLHRYTAQQLNEQWSRVQPINRTALVNTTDNNSATQDPNNNLRRDSANNEYTVGVEVSASNNTNSTNGLPNTILFANTQFGTDKKFVDLPRNHLTEKIDSLEEENDNLRKEIEKLKQDMAKNDNYDFRMSIENENKSLKKEIEELKKSSNDLKSKMDSYESTVSDKDNEIEGLKKTIEEFKVKNSEIQESNNNYQNLYREANKMKSDLLANMGEKEVEFSKESELNQKEINELKLRIEELKEDEQYLINFNKIISDKLITEDKLLYDLNQIFESLYGKLYQMSHQIFSNMTRCCLMLESIGLLLIRETPSIGNKPGTLTIKRVKGLRNKKRAVKQLSTVAAAAAAANASAGQIDGQVGQPGNDTTFDDEMTIPIDNALMEVVSSDVVAEAEQYLHWINTNVEARHSISSDLGISETTHNKSGKTASITSENGNSSSLDSQKQQSGNNLMNAVAITAAASNSSTGNNVSHIIKSTENLLGSGEDLTANERAAKLIIDKYNEYNIENGYIDFIKFTNIDNTLVVEKVFRRFNDVEQLARKLQKDKTFLKSEVKTLSQQLGHSINIKNFKVGDLVLFLPILNGSSSLTNKNNTYKKNSNTNDADVNNNENSNNNTSDNNGNSSTNMVSSFETTNSTSLILSNKDKKSIQDEVWAVFNVGSPYYYLSNEEFTGDSESNVLEKNPMYIDLYNRDWVLGTIESIESNKVTEEDFKDSTKNPYQLPVDTTWYSVKAKEEGFGRSN
ncbi:hypothetical protein B5S33_g2525 [[Candida] boidinii]|nr:hypothetical protein B5S30_g1957 [[Candida] boidinii]OWB83890.1 hypothetical protein B5S33_g2525 [[Candida] boidinii]